MQDAEIMRTTLDIDDDVLQAAKEIAEVRGQTAGQVVSELLRKAIQSPRDGHRQKVRNGVPLIRRRGGVPILTVALVNALRDDE
jgi:hypothetical protein